MRWARLAAVLALAAIFYALGVRVGAATAQRPAAIPQQATGCQFTPYLGDRVTGG